ncbi:sigma 54-interacting transcriptional regulator [Desulfoluna spongiiphila]|uniref:Two-component system, NtrC family, nitrogen regulation response regulator GlnG n=1 Tax=Desulfoluna spongiiphila TaxID=419481 RepID=A0A1G5BXV9_9BACT|nr:sigma-54 dependent transcriptional regulator [Desulfoluna spongiiphila]SCX94953.1 two-component system, NtrC family, nitrogen regulation response regulator GlnG [Desulfoluna spongiiphila]VVS93976.1 rna polymerase sigma factor 54 interaction domain [Desulfoluna spongiiphila]
MSTILVGVSPAMNKIRETVSRIARNAALNVVITGETGVGKEVVARSLYETSLRNKKEFVKVNCAAIPDTLLESELFGIEQGAYTGAHKMRKGKFELADDGVLFLDEIGDMTFHLQAKLLHVLQSGEYSRLGSETNLRSNTWVISATNHDLQQKIEKKEFRQDLYYRLNMVKIHIPPLRERPEDIPELIAHYTQVYRRIYTDREISPLNTYTFDRLCRCPWPGNVRQLLSALKRILLIGCDQATLSEILDEESPRINGASPAAPPIYDHLMGEIRDLATKSPEALADFSLKGIKQHAVDIIEREAISQILTMTNWNRTRASKILKISYKTLLTKISQLHITKPQ